MGRAGRHSADVHTRGALQRSEVVVYGLVTACPSGSKKVLVRELARRQTVFAALSLSVFVGDCGRLLGTHGREGTLYALCCP